jgi:hypothetical protein
MNRKMPAEPAEAKSVSQPQPGQDIRSLTLRLIRLLAEQQERADQLERLSTAQSAALLGRQFDAVAELISAREPVITELQHGAEECRAVAEAILKPLGTGHRSSGSTLAATSIDRQRAILAAAAPEHREALETAADRLDTTLLGIERRDAADQTALKTHRDDVARQMAGTVVTRGAAQAYGGLDAPQGVVYQDRHG